jgi:hypothetical protein
MFKLFNIQFRINNFKIYIVLLIGQSFSKFKFQIEQYVISLILLLLINRRIYHKDFNV